MAAHRLSSSWRKGRKDVCQHVLPQHMGKGTAQSADAGVMYLN